MHATPILGLLSLVGLPLAVALPSATGTHPRHARHSAERRRIDVALAQFEFKPYVLSNTCFDCTRPNDTALYSCSIQCKIAYSPQSTYAQKALC